MQFENSLALNSWKPLRVTWKHFWLGYCLVRMYVCVGTCTFCIVIVVIFLCQSLGLVLVHAHNHWVSGTADNSHMSKESFGLNHWDASQQLEPTVPLWQFYLWRYIHITSWSFKLKHSWNIEENWNIEHWIKDWFIRRKCVMLKAQKTSAVACFNGTLCYFGGFNMRLYMCFAPLIITLMCRTFKNYINESPSNIFKSFLLLK